MLWSGGLQGRIRLFSLPLLRGRGQRGAARPSPESAVTCLAPGHLHRRGNRPFSHFPLTTTKACSRGLMVFPKLCFPTGNCHRPARTDSIKVFLGNLPRDPAWWTTQLLFIHDLGTTDLPESKQTFFFVPLISHLSQLPQCSYFSSL